MEAKLTALSVRPDLYELLSQLLAPSIADPLITLFRLQKVCDLVNLLQISPSTRFWSCSPLSEYVGSVATNFAADPLVVLFRPQPVSDLLRLSQFLILLLPRSSQI
jgi:hypothetical protein